nr:hypothetical protein [Tanacetum cinerariifolium]
MYTTLLSMVYEVFCIRSFVSLVDFLIGGGEDGVGMHCVVLAISAVLLLEEDGVGIDCDVWCCGYDNVIVGIVLDELGVGMGEVEVEVGLITKENTRDGSGFKFISESGRRKFFRFLFNDVESIIEAAIGNSLMVILKVTCKWCEKDGKGSCISEFAEVFVFKFVFVVEHEHVVMNPTLLERGFPAQSVRSSNAYALDSPYLLVLNIETSQNRQHDMSESDSDYLSD